MNQIHTAFLEHHPVQTVPSQQLLTVEWKGGVESPAEVTKYFAGLSGGYPALFKEIGTVIRIYLQGPEGENESIWRERFGSVHSYIPLVETSIGFVSTTPNSPHLLRLWGANELLIARITSFDFDELSKLNNVIGVSAKLLGFLAHPARFESLGLIHSFSRIN